MIEKTVCPQCKNDNCLPGHSYCWKCGFELGNYCLNPDCPVEIDGDPVTLPDEYVHCPHCGHITNYGYQGLTPDD